MSSFISKKGLYLKYLGLAPWLAKCREETAVASEGDTLGFPAAAGLNILSESIRVGQYCRWYTAVLCFCDILVRIRTRGSLPLTSSVTDKILLEGTFTLVFVQRGHKIPGSRKKGFSYFFSVLRIRIRDPVAFWPLDPRSGMGFFRIPDLGSRDHILKSFLTIFWVKSSIILWKLAQIFFFSTSKLK